MHAYTRALIVKGMPLYVATRSALVKRSGCTVSNIFFFGFSSASGLPASCDYSMIYWQALYMWYERACSYVTKDIWGAIYCLNSKKRHFLTTIVNICIEVISKWQSLIRTRKALELYEITGHASLWRGENLNLAVLVGTHHHRLRHDPPQPSSMVSGQWNISHGIMMIL